MRAVSAKFEMLSIGCVERNVPVSQAALANCLDTVLFRGFYSALLHAQLHSAVKYADVISLQVESGQLKE